MDPVVMNAAARMGGSVLGALRQPKIRVVRLGSREERRDVYTRFATASIGNLYARVERVNHYRLLKAEGMSPEQANRQGRRDLAVYLRQAHEEFMYAQFEVELAGTESVVEAAQLVIKVLELGHRLPLEADDRAIDHLSTQTEAAVNDFVRACRIDLWYATRWWHLHRHALRAGGRFGRWLWQPVRKLSERRAASGRGGAVDPVGAAEELPPSVR